jgi:hypothetical protein
MDPDIANNEVMLEHLNVTMGGDDVDRGMYVMRLLG